MKKTGNRNIAPKVISILFALLLWIYVTGTLNPRSFRNFSNVPVTLINVEEMKEHGLAIKNDDLDNLKVKVRLTGRRDEVYKISSNQIQVRADLKGYGLGKNNISLEVVVPNNIEADVSPRFISVEFEKIIKQEKEVSVEVLGKPKEDFVTGNFKYQPTKVWIEGAESYVNSIENIIAELDLTGITDNIALNLPLKPINNKGEEVKNVDLKTSHVEVSLQVDLLKTVPIKPDLQINTQTGYKIRKTEINPTSIILRGQKELIDNISEIVTKPIKADNLDKNETLNVELDLPEGVILYRETPMTIDLHLEKLEEKNYEISKDEIIFINADEKLKVDTSDMAERINIKIVALRSILDLINKNDIKIVVNLNDLDANEYTVEPILQIPFISEEDIEEINLDPKTIDFRLIEK